MATYNRLLKLLFGDKSARDTKKLLPIIKDINHWEDSYSSLSNDSLRQETFSLRQEIQQKLDKANKEIADLKEAAEGEQDFLKKEDIFREVDRLEAAAKDMAGETLNEILPRAFAIVRETARRFTQNEEIEVTPLDYDRELATRFEHIAIRGERAYWKNEWMAGGNPTRWSMVHYDCQLVGGIVLHQGKIAEMATGEGKTLVATLPVFLNALLGEGVHVITVNDYLAKRDAEWMGPIFQFHGLTVDCIDRYEPHSEERKQAYQCDITYGTNNEFGFDYLRDNMVRTKEELVQRSHHFAIVDEVDSVLIDDARTPLIISGPTAKSHDEFFYEFRPHVQDLIAAQQKLVGEIFLEARKKVGEAKNDKERHEAGLLLLRCFKGLPKYKPLIKLLSEQGNKALMLKTEGTYLQDNAKRMPEVTDPLYFVISEAQRSVDITDKGTELLSENASEADFFIMPDIGSQIAELEEKSLSSEEKAKEKDAILQDFSIKSERIHAISNLLKAYSLFEKDIEYVVMDNQVKIVDEQTGRIMEGRRYSDGLHEAIEAKENVTVEGATQTYATITLQNYFRMYYKLAGMTGTAETEASELYDIYKLEVIVIPTNRPIIRQDEKDFVFKTQREKYKAVIEEITSLVKKKRPVLVGTTSVEVSELLSKMLNMQKIKHNVLNAKLHAKEADIVAQAGKPGNVTIATNMAGRGTDIKLPPEVVEAGGLAIVGTERHESRRVDRQLRGRAGRQGDPGSSQFFVSFEDPLMRLYPSERIIRMMDRMGMKEGESLQHSLISNAVEKAQKRMETNYFGMRKRNLEYDDVMNKQREVIYTRRRHALMGQRLDVDVANMFMDSCRGLVEQHRVDGDYHTFSLECLRHLSIEVPFDEQKFIHSPDNVLIEELFAAVSELYDRRKRENIELVMPQCRKLARGNQKPFSSILIPLSDGQSFYKVLCNLDEIVESDGAHFVRSIEKTATLSIIDDEWREHLRELDDLQLSVRNAQYEQKDPLLIYKLESFELFRSMIVRLNEKITSQLLKAHIPDTLPEDVVDKEQVEEAARASDPKLTEGRQEVASGSAPEKTRPRNVGTKVGRNDPCPCGSGKKYKKCHGQAS